MFGRKGLLVFLFVGFLLNACLSSVGDEMGFSENSVGDSALFSPVPEQEEGDPLPPLPPPPLSNNPQFIDPPTNQVIVVGNTLDFLVQAEDPDSNDTVTLTIDETLPEGASFTTTISGNPTSATFNWTPNENQMGNYPLTFRVSDGNPDHDVTVLVTLSIAVSSDQTLVYIDGNLSETCFGTYSIANRDCSGPDPEGALLDAYHTFNFSGDFPAAEITIVRGGTYPVTQVIRLENIANITLTNFADEEPLLDAGNADFRDNVFLLKYCTNIHVSGLAFTGWNGHNALSVHNCDGVTLERLHLYESNPISIGIPGYNKRNGIDIRATHNFELRNTEIERIHGNAVGSHNSTDLLIERTYIHDLGEPDSNGDGFPEGNVDGIATSNDDQVVIRNVVIHTVADACLDLTGDTTIPDSDDKNHLVENSVFLRGANDGGGVKLWSGTHTFRNNFVAFSKPLGVTVVVRADDANQPERAYAKIYGNTFYRNKMNLGLASASTTFGSSVELKNNVFSFPDNWMIYDPPSGPTHLNINGAAGNCDSRENPETGQCRIEAEENNLFYQEYCEISGCPEVDESIIQWLIQYENNSYRAEDVLSGQWASDFPGLGLNLVYGDPLFVNPPLLVNPIDWQTLIATHVNTDLTSDDFGKVSGFDLQAQSPARNQGQILDYHCPSAGPHPEEDCREWYGSAPDIGAFEFVE